MTEIEFSIQILELNLHYFLVVVVVSDVIVY